MHTLSFPIIFCLLSACAGKQQDFEYDTSAYKPAHMQKKPALPVKIVEVVKPVPLPGQLKRLSDSRVKTNTNPHKVISAAHKRAKIMPSENGYINAIQTYPFMEGALYQLYAAPGKVTDIMLQAGETLNTVSAGDTLRWIIGDTTSGSGQGTRTHILIKPVAPDLKTNLVILTDRRSYHLDMMSYKSTYMASLSWHYPKDELLALKGRNNRAFARRDHTVKADFDLNNLNFRYEISGDTPPWRPIQAFDDGHKVYIQFPERLDQGEAPPLFISGEEGKVELVNYRVKGNTYIVDRLFKAAELRLGEKKQQIVRITRKVGRR
ncbi:MAG: P-type conjugative transfer protein TrbG [Opitutaceae bacterium]|nr:P-type conjugative transfer protein TrbG [Opitutaceae bacterium]